MTRPNAAQTYDVIILGAGGAGLMCAGVAVQRGLRVLVLDHADKPGKKILISGGGRCNFTNVDCVPERFLSANPHFAKSALNRYTAADFLALVERNGIAWHEKTLGQLFCDGSARQIVDMLMAEADGADYRFGEPVQSVTKNADGFDISSGGKAYRAARLVIATGGPSIPKMGATGYAYDLARQFGLKVVEPRPALVPLTLPSSEALFRGLSGVSTPVIATAGGAAFPEAALFTHKGLSGPAILQASSYWRHREPIVIDFLQGALDFIAQKKSDPNATLANTIARVLPARLSEVLAERIGLSGTLAAMKDRDLQAAQARLNGWTFQPDGTEGFAKAEVTVGGVSTNDLSSKTMEAKRVPGLYFVGEAVDVTGWLGGYNFQWAWSSGWAAGQAL